MQVFRRCPSVMVRLFFIGFPGSGKTTLGRAFAREAGLGFVDLDWFIEQRYHTAVASLFAERGEAGFRKIEGAALREVGEFEDVVISCGGGTPCYAGNMDYMLSSGVTVYLRASEQVLFRRLSSWRASRPLLAGKQGGDLLSAIRQSLAEREPFYSRARYTITTDGLDGRSGITAAVGLLRSMLRSDGVLP